MCSSDLLIEIRYEPEWLNDITKELPIYEDGKRVGEAKVVRFHDNAHAMRKFKGNRRKSPQVDATDDSAISTSLEIKNSISYSEMMEGEDNV